VAAHDLDRTSLPETLQPVVLRIERTVGDPVVATTRVMDVEDAPGGLPTLVVSCPPELDPLEHHLHAELSWTCARGRMSRAVSAHPGRRAYGRVWQLVPAPPVMRLQERMHFRAGVAVPVRLQWYADRPARSGTEPEEHELDGVTVDLSEGGALAFVRTTPPPPGTTVITTLRIDGEELQSPATVVRHVDYPGGAGVAVRFADRGEHGDRLRRAAFEAERRAARAGSAAADPRSAGSTTAAR